MTAPVLCVHCRGPVRGRSPARPPLCRRALSVAWSGPECAVLVEEWGHPMPCVDCAGQAGPEDGWPYARRLRDRRRKRDRAWRETAAWLAAHPGPSSAEAFAEYGRLRREQAEIRAAMYRASWEQVFQRMEAVTW